MDKILWKKVTDLSWTKLGPEMLILDGRRQNLVHEFNEVATFIWEQLEYAISLEEIEKRVLSEFEVTESEVKEDVRDFILLLKKYELVIES